jgi:cell volume regulation protein A
MFMKFNVKEKLLISWAGLRGAVPIVLATYPLIAGIEDGHLFFNVVFFVVLTSALIQGATISPLANLLGLSEGKKTIVPHALELVSMGKTNHEIVEIQVSENSAADGQELRQLKMPQDSLVNAIIRDQKMITPRGHTRLQAGDTLYVLARKGQTDEIKALFHEQVFLQESS